MVFRTSSLLTPKARASSTLSRMPEEKPRITL